MYHLDISIIIFFNTEESFRECSNYHLNQVVILISVTFTLTVIVKHYKPNLCRCGRLLFFRQFFLSHHHSTITPPCPHPPSPHHHPPSPHFATITPNQSIQIQERDNNLLTLQRQGCRG